MYLKSVLVNIESRKVPNSENLYQLNEAIFNMPEQDYVSPKISQQLFKVLEKLHQDFAAGKRSTKDANYFYEYTSLLGTIQNQSFLNYKQRNKIVAWLAEACGCTGASNGKKAEKKVDTKAVKTLEAEVASLRAELKQYKELSTALTSLAKFQPAKTTDAPPKGKGKGKGDEVKPNKEKKEKSKLSVPSVKLNSGHRMPLVGLGCWKNEPGQVEGAVRAALTSGVTHIDCASIYANEAQIGEVFAEMLDGKAVRRKDMFITGKLWNTEHAADRVRPACQKSITDLKLEYLDLYLIHWPFVTYDHGVEKEEGMKEVHFTETWVEMEKLVDDGLVKSIGLSNFNHAQTDEILQMCRIKPAVLQVECHPYNSQDKLVAWCKEKGIFLTAFSPLANPAAPDGMRMWGREGGWRDLDVMKEPSVLKIAKKYGKSTAQVVLRWQVQRKVIVIPKTKSPERVRENAQIFDFKLTKDEMQLVSDLHQGLRVCGYSGMKDHPLHPWGTKAQEAGIDF